MSCKVFELKCEVQQYAWGKLGMDSEVARLSKLAHSDFLVEERQPYAELWMGSHPKAPSMIIDNSVNLADFIKDNPTVLGEKTSELFKGELPFLFKVLSVNRSLSIQAHPNKSHAEKLHAEKPDIYKDPNHKPEMAIALTPFEGLCGFRPLQEIQDFLQTVPELRTIVGDEAAIKLCQCKADSSSNVQACLKTCFENVMKCNPAVRKSNLQSLVARMSKVDKGSAEFRSTLGELLLRLNGQFPGDVGCFVIYFLNHIRLSPGEAMYLSANVPHAYLDGNCIECMACSDNVVRAGLTPKLIDVPTLCEMLEYIPSSIESRKYPSIQSEEDPCIKIYNPPVPDFAVQCISVPEGTPEYTIASTESASIMLVLEGSGTTCGAKPKDLLIRPGAVLFISANTQVKISMKAGKLFAFRALCMF